MALPQWLQILLQLGPEILAFTPLAPIAPMVVAGIAAAEQIPGATGASKLASVQTIVQAGVQAVNAKAGKVVVDPAVVEVAGAQVISAVVGIVNSTHQLATATPMPAPGAPPPA